ncbi:CKLF-like MARVEL transmembrane domain-containing protein 1 [Marmota marmota marmota]|uniref:CKLF-like MARVEL transmembrane domain-containing protein 1 n=1 Tax=Marmota marmota marmota TaxID=9994 RepID=UPI000762300F|nr:CKLF-like MARVEL transmembrane domain-containing protein 1 [Marmota marmota marmota]
MDPQDPKHEEPAVPAAAPGSPQPPDPAPSADQPSTIQPSASVSNPPESKPGVAKRPASKYPATKRTKRARAFAPSGRAERPYPAQGQARRAPEDRRKPTEHPGTPQAPKESPGKPPMSRRAMVAVQKRAEGRAKVPETFRDSAKYFCFSPTGLLKILRLILLIAAIACFVSGKAHETYIAITIQEACIILVFILVYVVTLQHLLVFLHWPLFDLINSIISTVFLLVVAILTGQEKERRPLFYIGGVFCLVAAIVCLIDALVVTKEMRTAMKKAAKVKFVLPKAKKPKPQAS